MTASLVDTPDTRDEEDRSYVGQAIADIVSRESFHEHFAERRVYIETSDGLVPVADTSEQLLLDYMPILKNLHKTIMASDRMPVRQVLLRHQRKHIGTVYRLTRVGRAIQMVCKIFACREEEGRDWQHVYAHHSFHPVIAVMWEAVTRWWSPICDWWDPESIRVEHREEKYAIEALFQFAGHVRRVCGQKAFKSMLRKFDRKAKDNFRSACDLVTELFKRHSRLLVLRIDLYFRRDAKDWGYTEEADKAVKQYLRELREGRMVPDFLACIVKRESGICRGMHYHLMVFLNGHERQSAYHLTEMMGEAWAERMGADKGSYFNCYANRHRYRFNGLGRVHVNDTEKLMGLRVALWYMSKQDSPLMVEDGKGKNFIRSLLPTTDSKRGAPRLLGDGMDEVKRVLGGTRSQYPADFEQLQRRSIRCRRASRRPALQVNRNEVFARYGARKRRVSAAV